MAISVNNRTTIDDSRNLIVNQIDFADGTSLAAYNKTALPTFTLSESNEYNTQDGDNFGSVIAIDGNYAIVGVQTEYDATGPSAGKAYIFNVATGALLWTLSNPNAYGVSYGDLFGNSVAISGNYAIVSARLEDDTSGTDSGKAYIYNVTTGALLWTLSNPNAYGTSQNDQFGNSVAISGNYAIVGAYQEDDAGGVNSGKAYIYNVTTGSLLYTLDNPNAYSTSASDIFGQTVAISGNYAIVGNVGESDVGGTISGKVYIFNVTTGALVWTLNNPNAYSTSAGDRFGNSVAISDTYAIVGAYTEDDAAGADSGKAYIYNVTTGALLFTLNNPNAYSTSAGDYFGNSVAISGNYAIVGTNAEDDAGGTNSGKAYIYNVTTGALVYTLNNPNAYGTPTNDFFGYSVAISSNYAIVGAYAEDTKYGSSSGILYTVNLNNYSINTINNPNITPDVARNYYASSISISNDYVAVGFYNAPTFYLTSSSGNVHIYSAVTGKLLYVLNNPNAFNTSAIDYFGYRVAISGNYLIVSAPYEDDASGLNSGKVYIYNITTGQLLWTLNNPNAYGTSAYDYFGELVSISGNYAIVGARYEDDTGGAESGKAYIYNVTTGALLYTLNNPNVYGTSAGDIFGSSVSISGNYAIVGAWGESDASGVYSGKAYIFNVTTGQLLYTLNNPNAYDTSALDYFGYTVGISDNYAIVSANGEDDAGGASSGKAYIYNVTNGQLLYTLNNPNAYSTSAGDNFGWSVAISGNYAIVGANGEDDAGGIESGKAYIYNVTTGQLLYTLNNPNAYGTSGSDNFGSSVAISGNRVGVTSTYEGSIYGTSVGAAYLFNINEPKTYNLSSFYGLEQIADQNTIVDSTQLKYTLNNPNAYNTSLNDYFGFSTAISGNYAIVSAHLEDDAGGAQSGKAYIFNVTTGQLLYTLNNPNAYSTADGDNFGASVAISGNYAIVSAPSEDDANGVGSGKAYIYNVTTGTLLYTLNNPNAYSTSANDQFGTSVAISGNYAIVGARNEDDAGGLQGGKAYIYNVTTGALLWTLNDPNAYDTSASDQFGNSVAISGNYAIVGAISEDDASGFDSGKAYIYNVVTGQLLYTLNNPNPYDTPGYDNFGNSVAISGNYAIVGAYNEDDVGGSSSGKAYIYNVTTGTLLFTLNNPNAYSTSNNDQFAASVAISGNYAIISALLEDDAGGFDSGKAYIYNVVTGQLLYTLNNPNAYDTSASDAFGQSVVISGNYAIVGAYNEDDVGGSSSGKAYIYKINNYNSLEEKLLSFFN